MANMVRTPKRMLTLIFYFIDIFLTFFIFTCSNLCPDTEGVGGGGQTSQKEKVGSEL